VRRGADSQSARAGWRAGATLLLAVACAHKPPPPPAIPPPAVPRAAVDMMCTRMHTEGINGELRAVKTSQPLITQSAVMALAAAMFYARRTAPQIRAANSVPDGDRLDHLARCGRDDRPVLGAIRESVRSRPARPLRSPFPRQRSGDVVLDCDRPAERHLGRCESDHAVCSRLGGLLGTCDSSRRNIAAQ